MEVSDLDVLNVMLGASQQICDEARAKWFSGKYDLDDETRRKNIQRWNLIELRVHEIVNKLKGEL